MWTTLIVAAAACAALPELAYAQDAKGTLDWPPRQSAT
jgi:hypothetical protein